MKANKLLIRTLSTLILCSFLLTDLYSQQPALKGYPIQPVDIRSVTLTDNFWLPKIKLIQDTTIYHAFKKCDEEGRMENFLIAGKVKSGKTRGKFPFDDTDLYKTIEGASYSMISMPNPKLDAYLDSIISIIKIGQEPDGYITTWFTIDRKSPPADWVKPSTNRWENEITSHELYNSGHMFEAAAAHYWATGKRNFLEIALKNADLLVANFKPGVIQRPPGHEIVETGLVKLFMITQNQSYLNLAKYLVDLRGDSSTHTLYGAYNQDHIPVVKQDEAVGHAVRAEYLYAAMTDIAATYNDVHYKAALDKIWDNIVNKKMYLTGGVGSRHEGESFGDNYELPNLTAYNETCAAIGSVAWNQKMFMLTGDSKYYDIIERTLYNGLISGISSDGKLFFYPNPLESDAKFKFNQGALTRSSWFDCSCCPTNMIRFLPSLPSYIYATRADTVYANLFVSSKVQLTTTAGKLQLSQETNYPWNGNIVYSVNPSSAQRLSLRIRIPGWSRNETVPGSLYFYTSQLQPGISLKVNGKPEKATVVGGYITLTRTWKKGDKIELSMPMKVRLVKSNDVVKENNGKLAYELGPFVYCAEEADNKSLSEATATGEASVKVSKQALLGENVNTLLAGNVKLIPYYKWSNRGIGQMRVWLPAGK